MTNRYLAVSVPRELIPRIDKIIEGRGFGSRAAFIKFCVQKELSRMEGRQ